MTEPRLEVVAPKTLARRERNGGGGLVAALLIVLVLLHGVTVWLLLGGNPKDDAAGAGNAVAATSGPAAVRATAMRLEEMGVPAAAAGAWERYLTFGEGGDADRALLRYRVGKLWQEASEWDRALAAYVEAEKTGLAEPGAKRAIGSKILDCLKALGRYGAVGAELDRRTGLAGEGDKSPVVATFAGDTVTRAEFDRWLETRLDRSLAQSGMPPAQQAAQRDAMLKRYREPQAAARMLEDLVVQRLMLLRAREEKLDRDDALRDRLHEIEGLLAAEALVGREVTDKINPTETDLTAFFAANRTQYRTPPEATVRVIEVDSEKAGKTRLASLADAAAFVAAAPVVDTPIVRGRSWTPYGYDRALETAVFEAEPGTTLDRPFKVGEKLLLVHVEAKKPEADATLDGVRDRVRTDYSQRKRTELTDALVEDLKKRYDMRLDLAGLTGSTEKKPDKPEEKP